MLSSATFSRLIFNEIISILPFGVATKIFVPFLLNIARPLSNDLLRPWSIDATDEDEEDIVVLSDTVADDATMGCSIQSLVVDSKLDDVTVGTKDKDVGDVDDVE